MGLLQGLMGKLGGMGGGAPMGMAGGAPSMGLGGLLSGMGGKLNDFVHGTGAELSSTPRPDIDGGAGIGPIQQMPNIQETKAAQPGLLERMKTPDARGLTFGDKLFAAGSVMQGDSGGAATYLNNQRAAADQLSERTRSRDLASQGLDALRGAIDPATGQLNVQKYLASLPAGADPGQGLKVREALRPNVSPMSGPRGAIRLFDQDTGTFRPGGIEGEAAQQELYLPDGSINPKYIAGQQAEAQAQSAGRRAGAPPVFAPRGGGRGGGGAKGRRPIPSPGGDYDIVGP